MVSVTGWKQGGGEEDEEILKQGWKETGTMVMGLVSEHCLLKALPLTAF